MNLTSFEEAEGKVLKLILLSNRMLRHDVMNAVTSALLFLELFEKTGREEHLERAKASINRAVFAVRNSKFVEELAAEREPRYIKVEEIAREVARNFSIPVLVEGECQVFGDRGIFGAIFENLFQNAVQHSGTDRVVVKVERKRGKCFIRVKDYGKGIPDEIKDKIFSAGFSSGDSAGSGMGLHLVKEIVESIGGKIWVEDNEPCGAVFVMEFPRRFFLS